MGRTLAGKLTKSLSGFGVDTDKPLLDTTKQLRAWVALVIACLESILTKFVLKELVPATRERWWLLQHKYGDSS